MCSISAYLTKANNTERHGKSRARQELDKGEVQRATGDFRTDHGALVKLIAGKSSH